MGHEDFVRPMTVDVFLQKFDPIPLLPGAIQPLDSLEREAAAQVRVYGTIAAEARPFKPCNLASTLVPSPRLI